MVITIQYPGHGVLYLYSSVMQCGPWLTVTDYTSTPTTSSSWYKKYYKSVVPLRSSKKRTMSAWLATSEKQRRPPPKVRNFEEAIVLVEQHFEDSRPTIAIVLSCNCARVQKHGENIRCSMFASAGKSQGGTSFNKLTLAIVCRVKRA